MKTKQTLEVELKDGGNFKVFVNGAAVGYGFVDQMSDTVLAYRPKPKTKAAKRRARRNKRAMKSKDKPKSRE